MSGACSAALRHRARLAGLRDRRRRARELGRAARSHGAACRRRQSKHPRMRLERLASAPDWRPVRWLGGAAGMPCQLAPLRGGGLPSAWRADRASPPARRRWESVCWSRCAPTRASPCRTRWPAGSTTSPRAGPIRPKRCARRRAENPSAATAYIVKRGMRSLAKRANSAR